MAEIIKIKIKHPQQAGVGKQKNKTVRTDVWNQHKAKAWKKGLFPFK